MSTLTRKIFEQKTSKKMIQLKYKKHSSQIAHWQEKLEALVIKHKVFKDSEIEDVTLIDGKETFVGQEAVNKHIIQLESYLQDWRACNCDKWLDLEKI